MAPGWAGAALHRAGSDGFAPAELAFVPSWKLWDGKGRQMLWCSPTISMAWV